MEHGCLQKEEIKEILSSIVEIKIILARQNEQLSYHIKRTDLLEKKVDVLQRFQYYALGAVAVATFLSGLAIKIFMR